MPPQSNTPVMVPTCRTSSPTPGPPRASERVYFCLFSCLIRLCCFRYTLDNALSSLAQLMPGLAGKCSTPPFPPVVFHTRLFCRRNIPRPYAARAAARARANQPVCIPFLCPQCYLYFVVLLSQWCSNVVAPSVRRKDEHMIFQEPVTDDVAPLYSSMIKCVASLSLSL